MSKCLLAEINEHLTPAPWRCAQIDHSGHSLQNVELVIDLHQLESAPRRKMKHSLTSTLFSMLKTKHELNLIIGFAKLIPQVFFSKNRFRRN